MKPVTSINSIFISVGEISSISATDFQAGFTLQAREQLSLQSAAALCCFPLRLERTEIWRWSRKEKKCLFSRKSRMLMQKNTKIIRFAMLRNLTGLSVSGMEKMLSPTDCLEHGYHGNLQGPQKVRK